MMDHIVFVSGGKASFELLRRVIDRYGKSNTIAIFADTKTEDPDLYRFLNDVERALDINIFRLAEGRTVWGVFETEGMMGNSRIDPCSRILKRDLLMSYLKENYSPDDTIVHLGLDWQEEHRIKRVRKNYERIGYRTEFLLAEPPYQWGDQYMASIRSLGIEPPHLYLLGFEHNNCGGTCVKAGQAQWAMVYRKLPARFADWEAKEQQFREDHGDVSILRDWKNGGRENFKTLTLREFRHRLENGGQVDMFVPASCTCFVE
jgi:3'-phosphoadenosine 5'-phosphosulfate sulfotransferase (PAPS reductase)/FAD synthetase